MFFSASLIALAAPYLVAAAPVPRGASANDALVFQFANVLEQLETQFYTQALKKFQNEDFTKAGFRDPQLPIQQFKAIRGDEATHTDFIQGGLMSLGQMPINNCKFDFSSVLTDVATMAATARLVENVGVAAYLGGATLIDDPILLDAAASILTVEARHQTILNVLSSTGSAIPQAFDIPLSPPEVLAIAGPFISGCDLGIMPNPTLSITNKGNVRAGTLLTFSADKLKESDPNELFCQMLIGGMATALPFPLRDCRVPEGINGPVAVFITSDGQPLLNNVLDRATSQLVAGPTFAFIDSAPERIGQLSRTSSDSGSDNSEDSGSDDNSEDNSDDNSEDSNSDDNNSDDNNSDDNNSDDNSNDDNSNDSSSSNSGNDSKNGSSTNSASSSSTTSTISIPEAKSIIASASAAATSTASAASASGSAAPPTIQLTTNMFTGPSQDNAVVVDGWTIPAGYPGFPQ